MLLEENELLAPFTTIGIGGPARWFVTAENEDEIAEAAKWTRDKGIELFVLGGGSNLLVSDAGFDGLVLRIGMGGVDVHRDESRVLYRVGAGEQWDRFVQRSVEDGSAGLECLAGIPGTVGGTPVQNVGAYGQEVASTIECVRAFDLQSQSFIELAGTDCDFAYRRSRFNTTDRDRYVVTRVDFSLRKGGVPSPRYADLQREFPVGVNAGLTEVAAAVRRIRQSKGMLLVEGDPDCRSAGSFFKNPVVDEARLRHVAAVSGQEPPCFTAGSGSEYAGCVKLSAAWLIERAGFVKGFSRGAAGLSSQHTLALINRGGATAAEILALAEEIRTAVVSRYRIWLEMEPVLLGFK